MLQMIIGLSINALLLALVFYLVFNYYFFWYKICQFNEPFTRWISRLAEKWPYEWFIGHGLLVIGLFALDIFVPWYYKITVSMFIAFYGWFIPHIIQYVIDNHGNNPPHFWKLVLSRVKKERSYACTK
jgi:hypothetical protein